MIGAQLVLELRGPRVGTSMWATWLRRSTRWAGWTTRPDALGDAVANASHRERVDVARLPEQQQQQERRRRERELEGKREAHSWCVHAVGTGAGKSRGVHARRTAQRPARARLHDRDRAE